MYFGSHSQLWNCFAIQCFYAVGWVTSDKNPAPFIASSFLIVVVFIYAAVCIIMIIIRINAVLTAAAAAAAAAAVICRQSRLVWSMWEGVDWCDWLFNQSTEGGSDSQRSGLVHNTHSHTYTCCVIGHIKVTTALAGCHFYLTFVKTAYAEPGSGWNISRTTEKFCISLTSKQDKRFM